VLISSSGYDASNLSIDTADAEFIAAARTLVPELIAEVERLRAQLKDRTEWKPAWGSPYDVMGDAL
jgi:hypothetical protein